MTLSASMASVYKGQDLSATPGSFTSLNFLSSTKLTTPPTAEAASNAALLITPSRVYNGTVKYLYLFCSRLIAQPDHC